MDEPQRWGRSRYLALLSALALHVTVLAVLIIAVRTRSLTTTDATPIELLILPKTAAPAPPPLPPPPLPDRRKNLATMPAPIPPESLTVVPPNSGSSVTGPAIDWSQEAHNTAEDLARDARPNDELPAPALKSAFAPPPAHHKGDQVPTADGRWIVYVSDNCYQVSKSITAITNATNTGVGIQTYCNQKSKAPRGDLFDQLPAYKKLHPAH
jgi:hypothetical protein